MIFSCVNLKTDEENAMDFCKNNIFYVPLFTLKSLY